MKRVLLTGSNGFIGKHLKEKWENKYILFTPTSKELDLRNLEKTEEYIKDGKFDIVVHAANRNETRNRNSTPYDSLDGNLRMYFNLERCRDYYEKMLYFGSGAEYDRMNYVPDMSEDYFGTHIPKDAYGFSKYIMSKTCEQEKNIFDLRLFGVYGKYEEWERRFISNAICRVILGMDITIEKNIYFDYLWIDDLARIMEWFISNTPKYRHYNVCSGTKLDLFSIACLIRETLNIDCKILVKEPGFKPEYTGNNQRLMAELKEFEFTDYRQTISELYQYYKDNIEMLDASKLL